MRRPSTPRTWIWASLVIQGVGLAFDYAWHGLNPDFKAVTVGQMVRWWSGSSAIRLSPPQIRASGFPALGSSRRLPNAGQRDLARVSDSGRRKREARQQRVEPLPRKATLAPPAKHPIPAARDRLVKTVQPRPVARQTVVGVVPPQHAAQPAMLRPHRCMHAAPHLRLDLV